MKITIAGTPGSGKSTVGKLLASKLEYNHYSAGQMMRDMAEEKNITLLELSKEAEKDMSIDMEIDDRSIQIGQEEDNFVMDAHVGFHFIKDSVKIFLDAPFEVRAKRILEDTIRNELNINIETTKEKLERREFSEKDRYGKYYNIDPYEKSQFDLVLDSTTKTPDELVDEILKYLDTLKS